MRSTASVNLHHAAARCDFTQQIWTITSDCWCLQSSGTIFRGTERRINIWPVIFENVQNMNYKTAHKTSNLMEIVPYNAAIVTLNKTQWFWVVAEILVRYSGWIGPGPFNSSHCLNTNGKQMFTMKECGIIWYTFVETKNRTMKPNLKFKLNTAGRTLVYVDKLTEVTFVISYSFMCCF